MSLVLQTNFVKHFLSKSFRQLVAQESFHLLNMRHKTVKKSINKNIIPPLT